MGPGGTRFMNETASSRHGRIDIGGSWIMMPTPCPAFIVTDSQGIHTKFCSSFSEDNADEIADGLGIPGRYPGRAGRPDRAWTPRT